MLSLQSIEFILEGLILFPKLRIFTSQCFHKIQEQMHAVFDSSIVNGGKILLKSV